MHPVPFTGQRNRFIGNTANKNHGVKYLRMTTSCHRLAHDKFMMLRVAI